MGWTARHFPQLEAELATNMAAAVANNFVRVGMAPPS